MCRVNLPLKLFISLNQLDSLKFVNSAGARLRRRSTWYTIYLTGIQYPNEIYCNPGALNLAGRVVRNFTLALRDHVDRFVSLN